jgi:hypothetical protein
MTAPFLEGYPRCHGSDPARMQAYLDTVGFRVESLRDDDAPLDMRVNGVYLPGMYIGIRNTARRRQFELRPSAPTTGSCCRFEAASKRACARMSSTAIRGGGC